MLIYRMVHSFADHMNSLTESPSCLQKVPVYQPMLPKAQSDKDIDLMMILHLAKLMVDPSRLFELNPRSLNLTDWFSVDIVKKMRRDTSVYIYNEIVDDDSNMKEEVHGSMDSVVHNIFTLEDSMYTMCSIDMHRFNQYVSSIDIQDLHDEEYERIKVEYYYIN